jgi:hypothetical protein
VNFLDVLAIIVEVLSWVGLGVGVPLFVVALILRVADGHWHEVDIEIVEPVPGGAEEPVARWFADDELRERALTAEERDAIADPDAATAFAGRGGRLRFERHGALARVFWVLSLVLLGVGVVALAGTIVLMLVMG